MRRQRRRRYTAPDGIDWRDPKMPVLRPFEFRDGTVGLKAFTPEEEQEFRRDMIHQYPGESYKLDPSYRWGKGKGKRKL